MKAVCDHTGGIFDVVQELAEYSEGDMIEFGGLLGSGPVMRINEASSEEFIKRGGRIPAPIHSFKN